MKNSNIFPDGWITNEGWDIRGDSGSEIIEGDGGSAGIAADDPD